MMRQTLYISVAANCAYTATRSTRSAEAMFELS